MCKKILLFSSLLLSLCAFTASADELEKLDGSRVSGYYYSADDSVLLMPNGSLYSVQAGQEPADVRYQAEGTVDQFIVCPEDSETCLYFSRQKEKEGNFFAVYSDYAGTAGETEFNEGTQIQVGKYIFGNDYVVYQKDSIARFFGMEELWDGITPDRIEGAGFDSPEEATIAFLEGLKDHNVSSMESAFAVETFAEKLNLDVFVDYIGSYSYMNGWVPNTDEFAVSINTSKRQENILAQIRSLYMILVEAKVSTGDTVGLTLNYKADETDLQDFIQNAFPKNDRPMNIRFDNLFIAPEAINERYLLETTQENMMRQTAFVQADAVSSVIALLSIDQENYLLVLDTIQYGEKWYVYTLGGTIGNMMGLSSYNPGLLPLSEEDYEAARLYAKPY